MKYTILKQLQLFNCFYHNSGLRGCLRSRIPSYDAESSGADEHGQQGMNHSLDNVNIHTIVTQHFSICSHDRLWLRSWVSMI